MEVPLFHLMKLKAIILHTAIHICDSIICSTNLLQSVFVCLFSINCKYVMRALYHKLHHRQKMVHAVLYKSDSGWQIMHSSFQVIRSPRL